MRKKPLLPVLVAFVIAGAVSVAAATVAVDRIETRSIEAIEGELGSHGLDWASVAADGLRVELTGTAPDEATRFRALSATGAVVDGSRVIDRMEVVQADPIAAPRFAIEILRADDNVMLIGLVPEATDRAELADDISQSADRLPVTDLMEVARHPAPATWDAALAFGLEALSRSEKAKVSIAADRVSLTTMAPDSDARATLERDLRRAAPEGVEIALDISAPRPVIAPFVLRLTREEGATSLVACSAGDEVGRDRIIAAATELGVEEARCRIGLGAPSTEWSAAASRALEAMRGVDTGTLSLSNLDLRIEAGPDVRDFGATVSALERHLPAEFTLTAAQADAEQVAAQAGPAEFIATRSPEGLVQMRGRMGTDRARGVVTSFGRALFGGAQMDTAIDVSPGVPDGWSLRVLAALDGLSILNNGAATVREDGIRISGLSGNREAANDLAQLMSGRLGEDVAYDIDVRYDERLDRELDMPTPEECVGRVNAILAERQITFDPGSSTIDGASRDSVEAIAAILRTCDGVSMEVGGYTDSQGREEMNRELSQSRAEAVLTALLSRRIPVGNLSAVGYGEVDPVADNATAAGREANRRIEFSLVEEPGAQGENETAEGAE